MNKLTRSYLIILLAIGAGVLSGLTHLEIIYKTAEALSTLFMNFLKCIAAPIVFLSIFSTLLGMSNFGEMRTLGKKVFTYTILTTVIAATTALFLYLIVGPASTSLQIGRDAAYFVEHQNSYLTFFLNIIPSNFVQAFLENNVIGIAFFGFLLGIAALKIPKENRESLRQVFSSFFKLVLKVTELIVFLLPIGIWAFITLAVHDLRNNSSEFHHVMLYLGVVLGRNLLQGLVVLPILLKLKKLSPLKVARGSGKALLLAFFSKSSNATLPVTLECAEKNLGIQSKTAHFSLPLCTVINMNGCAAFILTTVLFVSAMNGIVFSPWQLGLWVVLATIAAIGNAGVPMGCFFLSSAFLMAMDVPLTLMGLILPFYAFLDMVETALNVWSDITVTTIIDKELKEEATATALPFIK